MKKFKKSRLSTDFRKLQTLALKIAFWTNISEYIFLPTFIFAKMQGSKVVHYFSSSFTSDYFSPTRYSMFVVHLVFALWSFTLLICRVVYQWSGLHMKPCSTDDTPSRATCKKTIYICINNLIAEQKLVIASREKKEAWKTINATGLTIVTDANTIPPPSLKFIYLKCNRRYVSFCFQRWSYGVLLYEIFTIGKVL